MPNVLAIVPIDLDRNRFGQPSHVATEALGRSFAQHTIDRLSRVEALAGIVLVHPPGQDPSAMVRPSGGAPVHFFENPCPPDDRWNGYRQTARKWALESWRGGLGSMTCFDELFPADALLAAARAHGGDVALLLGADWCLVDPALCERVVARHVESPDAMKMTFALAPPGACGMCMQLGLLGELWDGKGTIGGMVGYKPSYAQPDPIGRDVCVQTSADVYTYPERLIADTTHSAQRARWIIESLGDAFADADAAAIMRVARQYDASHRRPMPRFVSLELTPSRQPTGPILPQAHVNFDRPPIDADLACRVIEQLGEGDDICLTIGGLGDPLMHDDWRTMIDTAHEAGVFGIAVETDLLVDDQAVDALLDSPVDLVSVRVNADTQPGYREAMGVDGFPTVVRNLEGLINGRGRRDLAGAELDPPGPLLKPWIVPRLVKTAETLEQMEMFFDRWLHFVQHAVIEPAQPGRSVTGDDLMPRQSPVEMAPPKRVTCRQLRQRMTILSDGRVARCDQDWQGEAGVGDLSQMDINELWQRIGEVRSLHDDGRWDAEPMCAGCGEWHRP